MTEKGQYEEELAKFREQTRARMQGVVMQCEYSLHFIFSLKFKSKSSLTPQSRMERERERERAKYGKLAKKQFLDSFC